MHKFGIVGKPTAELENLAMSPSLSSAGLPYDTKFVHIGWELRSSLVGDTILGVQSEPACTPSVDGVMEAPRLVCAFLESWDARKEGIRVKTEDELSMPAEKPGYASHIPAPQLSFFYF